MSGTSAPSAGSPTPSESSDRQRLMSAAVVLLLVSSVFFVFAAWYRLASARGPTDGPNYPVAGPMPEGFAKDHSPEAKAFRDVCTRCHNLPGPRMFDQVGWRGIVSKMGRQMYERGINIPKPKIELAVAFLMKHARPMTLSPLPNLSGVEPQVVAAIEAAHQALSANLKSAEAWGELGMTYHAHNLYEAAMDGYRHAEVLAPKDYRWPHLIGVVREGDLDPRLAVEAFARSAELNPKDTYARVRLGTLAVEAGKDKLAKKHFLAALEADPDCVAALLPLGELLGRKGDDEAAMRYLENALRLEPGCGPVHAALAVIVARRPDGAERSAQHARYAEFLPRGIPLLDQTLFDVDQRGVGFQARIQRGEQHKGNRNFVEALEQFREAVTLRPNDAGVRVKVAEVLRTMRRYDEAREAYQLAIEKEPDYAKAFVGLAGVEAPLRQFDSALRAIGRAIELEPDLAVAHLVKGQIFQGMGKDREALAGFDRAIALRPKQAPAHMRRGEILLKLGEPHEARDTFRRATELRPDLAFGFKGFGVAWMELNQPIEAAAAFAQAAARDGDDLTARINLILALRAAGRPADADRALRDAQQQWRGHPLLERIRAGQAVPVRLRAPS